MSQRAFAVLLFAGVVFAGCAQPAALPPEPAAVPVVIEDPFHPAVAAGALELVVPKVLPSVLVDVPGFAEPNIAVGHDGAIYIANPMQVWRSTDAGATWTATASKGIEGGGDADIALDANGTLYYLGLFGDDDRAIPFLASADQGGSWGGAVDVSGGNGRDREWIDVTPEGSVYATWRGRTQDGATRLFFNRSIDRGATWLPELVEVAPDGDQGPIAHDPVSGALALSAVDFAARAGLDQPRVWVYTSTDEGDTWEAHETATLGRSSPVEPNGYASDFPVVAFDGAGTLYLVYSADASGYAPGVTPPEELARYGIYMQVSLDQGATWSEPRLLSDPTKDARFPWIAAGAPGRVAVVWYENVRGVPGEMLPDEWNVMLYESITGDQDEPEGIVVTLTQKPNHLGSLCTSGTGCLAADRSMLDFFEVAIDLRGQPVVAFASSDLGTGIGLAVRETEVHFVTVEGTSLL